MTTSAQPNRPWEDWSWLAGRAERAGDIGGIVEMGAGLYWLTNGARWIWHGVSFGALSGAVSAEAQLLRRGRGTKKR